MNPKTIILHKFKAFTSLFLILALLLPNSIPTASVCALPEEYPIKLSVTTDNQSAYLDWTMMDAGISRFYLTRATDTEFSENVTSWEFDAQTLRYADNLVLPDITYYYRVVAYSDSEKVGESNIESMSLPNNPEEYRSALTASVNGQNILLQWTDNFPRAIQVSLQRGTNFEFSENLTILEVDIENASYSDNAVLPGTTYYYRLVSQDNTAKLLQSNIVSISVPGLPGADSTESLPVPTNLKAEVEDVSIVLSWEIADSNIIGFRIEKSINEDFSADIVTIQTGNALLSFSDHNVLAGATYYYRVYALGLDQISVASDVVEATVPATRDHSSKEVPVPQDLSAWISQSQQLLLFWTCNATDVRGFFIIRAKDPGFKESLVASVVKGGITLYTDNTVEAGSTYYYRVHTWSQFGVSPPSGVIAVSLPAGDNPVYREELPSPLNISLSPTGPIQGILNWSNDKTDGLGFLILRSTDANFVENVRVTKVNAGNTNCVDNAIVPGVEYFYRIYSWDKTRISASFGTLSVLVPSSSKRPQTSLLVSPEQRVEIKSPSGKLSLVIPQGAVERQTQIVVTEHDFEADAAFQPIEGRPPLSLFSLEATDILTAKNVDVFRDNLEIRIQHDAKDWEVVDPESLHLYYLNEKTQQWEIVSGTFNRDTNQLVATTNHFSVYGEQGNPNIVGPGRVMASQVNLHAGTATYSYPLELPIGPGGFQPKLELQYNSGSVDEMKDRLAVGSWVGIGWSLSLGQIGFNAAEGKYYLDLNGSSYELTASGNEYYTKPVSNYKITCSNNIWTMLDREGVTYVFGDSDSSRLYINNGGSKTYYSWNLTLMQDTNGNKATVGYVQDIMGSSPNEWVRSIYPTYMRYGYIDASTYKMEIVFNIGHDGATSDGYLRSDNPISYSWYESYQCIVGYAWIPDSCDGACYVYFQWPYYPPPYPPCSQTPCFIPGHYDYSQPIYGTCYSSGSNPAPKVMENRRLNSIDIKVNGSTLRQYVFNYTTTSRVYDDSARRYYAGTMKLNSVTEQYPTGNQQDPWDNLPSVSFTYTNGNVNYYYNPSINWPFLTAVNSGYGGIVNFGYTQVPSTPSYIWTRQTVTSKTIDSGSNDSADEVYSFNYTGNPTYLGSGITAKFRGWNEVRETDAAGHYTTHYFFTTGTQEGKDGDKLTGREYRTLWYAVGGHILQEQVNNWIYPDVTGGYAVQLADTQTKTYNASNPGVFRTTKVGYSYDNYGNTVTESVFGDISDNADGSIVSRHFVPNTTLNILSKPVWEKVFSATESGGSLTAANTTKETYYYFDNGVDQYHSNSDWNVAPVKGNITRLEQKENAVDSVSSYFTYDSFGNKVTETDPNGNTTTYTIDTAYHIFPEMKTYPEVDGGIFFENCTYSPGTGDILTHTDINGQVTIYGYDYFNRLTSVDKPGGRSPDITYDYLAWGTIGQQSLLTKTYSDADNFTWEKQFFDGLGRIVQVQSSGEPNATHTIISSTTTYNNRGLVDRQYVSQDVASPLSAYYNSGVGTWKYTSFAYDALGRVTTQTNADSSTVTNDYSSVWQTLTTDENGHKKRNYYDAFTNLAKVEELAPIDMSFPLEGWNYRKRVTIAGSTAGAQTNYQMKLNVYKGVGVDASGSVYLNNHCKDDFSDVRFTNSDGSTLLDYWVESYMPGNSAVVWVEVDSIPSSPETASIYVYYGNASAVSASNGGNTMVFQEDFDGSFDNIWTVCAGTWDRADSGGYNNTGRYRESGTQDSFASAPASYHPGKHIRGEMYFENDAYYGGRLILDGIGGSYLIQLFPNVNQVSFYDNLGNETKTSHSLGAGTWYQVDYYLDQNGNWEVKLDNVLKLTGADAAITNFIQIRLSTDRTATRFDSIAVRNYVSPEPTWGICSNEEGSDNGGYGVYSTTTYNYDVLGNLTRVTDDAGNTTNITYNWFSQKVEMEDPDMGSWSYDYDGNGNLISQTDAKNQTIAFTYDALDRLVAKTYPQDSGMADIVYVFDDISGGNYGKNKRTGMTDAAGTISFMYDERGRLIQENRVSDNVSYVTSYSHDNADRLYAITYPETGSGRETVIQQYDERGLPDYLSGSSAGPLVSNVIYNQLGQMAEIDLGNGLKTTFSYWGLDHETASYGKLWEITTSPQGGGDPIQQVRHTWDAGGNLVLRQNLISSDNETFDYDFLDRLETVEGAYSENYTYSTIGNIDTKNGIVYSYGEDGAGPHAVTTVGSTGYDYDANGNMITHGGQTIFWDVENRPVSISDNTTLTTFVYDGDGKRIKKTENEETILYVNRYYEVNLTTTNVTSSYYLSDRLIAQKTGNTLVYIHQDHLGGTSIVSSENGIEISSINFYPFGATRSGNVPTDKKFTGQRLDGTGLYYYGARYYDAQIGRFISADTILPDFANPQALNRYTYVLNNPLQYIDPTGHWPNWSSIGRALSATGQFLAKNIDIIQTGLDVAGMIPVIGEAFDAVNGVIYAARGDAANAAMSFSAMVPIAGNVATGAKLAFKAIDKVRDVAKAVDKVDDIAEIAQPIAKKVHGNTAGDQLANLYGRYDKQGNLQKWGVTQDLKTRYSKNELVGDKLVPIAEGPRSEMLKLEREMVETIPGPMNHESWAGATWEETPTWILLKIIGY